MTRAAQTLLAAGLTLLALGAPASASDVHVVSIGNNLGHDGEVPLRYAERDASEVAAVLQQLGGVRGEHVIVALGEEAPAIRQTLLRANARLRGAGQGSALIVFYSGHADARGLHLGDTTLAYDELRAIVEGSPAAMRLLIVDSCRSGGVTRVKGFSAAEPFEITAEDRAAAEGLAIITSSAAGEDSQESERLRASFFSHHLVTALRGAADQDRDRRVTLEEAYTYTYHQTLRSSGRTTQLQHPTYRFDMKGRGDLVLTHLDGRARSAAQLRLDAPGTYLVIEGRAAGPVVAEAVVDAAGAVLSLPARRYFVQHRAPSYYREYQVALSAGETTALADHDFETFTYARLLRKGGGDRAAVHGLTLMVGAHGATLDGYDIAPQLVFGWTTDLPWLSLGVRGRVSLPSETTLAGDVTASVFEAGVGLVAQRYIDLPVVSVGLGLLLELTYTRQDFDSRGRAPSRSTVGAGVGALVTLQANLIPSLALQIEGGPVTYLFERAIVDAGVVTGSETATPLTWWLAGGLTWRF